MTVNLSFYFPLRHDYTCLGSWTPVLVDKVPTVGQLLYYLQESHSTNPFPNQSRLELSFYDVSFIPDITKLLEKDIPVDPALIDPEHRVNIAQALPAYLVAIASAPLPPALSFPIYSSALPPSVLYPILSPLPFPPSTSHATSLPPPTVENVPAVEIPGPVEFPVLEPDMIPKIADDQLITKVIITIAEYPTIRDVDLSNNNIDSFHTPLDKSPPWVQAFEQKMSRRREITEPAFRHLLECANRSIPDDSLTEAIRAGFVCNNGDVTLKSTGQTIRSRDQEFAAIMSTILPPEPLPYSESTILHWFQQFRDNVGRNPLNQPDRQLTLIAGRNMNLPEKLGIPIQKSKSCAWYRFKPDASLLRGCEPILFLEFESLKKDFTRQCLYGASMVKWMALISGRLFLIPLLYVYKNGTAFLRYMYENGNKIQYVQKLYNLNARGSRLEFLLTIYNIADREPVTIVSDKMRTQIRIFKAILPEEIGHSILVCAEGRSRASGHDSASRASVRDGATLAAIVDVEMDEVGNALSDGDDDGVNAGGDVVNIGAETAKKNTHKRRKRNPDPELEGFPDRDGNGKPSDGGGGGAGESGNGGGGGSGWGGAVPEELVVAEVTVEWVLLGMPMVDMGVDEGVTSPMLPEVLLHGQGQLKVQWDKRLGMCLLLKATAMSLMGKNILQITKGSSGLVAKIIRTKRERRFYNMRLNHPNIVKSEAFLSRPSLGLNIVTLPELSSLEYTLIRECCAGSFVSTNFLDMSYDLANGLRFPHSRSIAHMDIKPSNLVYHPKTFVLQIIDFNLVRWVKSPDELVVGFWGTPGWMAPEILQGKPFKPFLADLYSCGLVFRKMADTAAVLDDTRTGAVWIDELRFFASRLTIEEPSLRPPLDIYIASRDPFRTMNH
ncbi:hypothetical protein D9757_014552 [Collybiopsis confluens]|uniref:Protein kinase domain-containing protein n=1 Tax=Collybiopsis confluens TaxID=2823264 RepID=A0A8H5CXB8_9AGAR|nr:hypothetical protein D9757_014552 [Collybiopsis confluens]